MPTIVFYGPELDEDRKRELIKRSAFVVYLHDMGADRVGVGGELLKTGKRECSGT